MSKIFESYYGLLFGLLGFLSILIPGIKIEYTLIFSLAFSTLFLLVVLLNFRHKYKLIAKIQTENQKAFGVQKEKTNLQFSVFVQSRKMFMKHELQKIRTITTDQYAELKSGYRGKVFEPILEEMKLSKEKVEDIIDKEMRDFDEQLFSIQSDKDY